MQSQSSGDTKILEEEIHIAEDMEVTQEQPQQHEEIERQGSVGARTLTVLKMDNSAGFWELVSGATALNSLRAVGAESKTLFCNKPMV